MSFPRIVVLGTVSLFSIIGILGGVKKAAQKRSKAMEQAALFELYQEKLRIFSPDCEFSSPIAINGNFPEIDRTEELFTPSRKMLPIVETVTYSSSVSWLRGRPAWISDYAKEYSTSRYFIARSLNQRAEYSTPTVFEGSKFNVFSQEKPIDFYLIADLAQCKLGLYYYDRTANERIFIKSYPIGVGRLSKEGDSLTPVGRFVIGDQVGIYNKGVMGYHLATKTEMIQVFGTRWIPFDGASGIGIQGAPWVKDPKTEDLYEDVSSIGKQETNGCIRMAQQDIEELYSIIITKPTFIEVVKELQQAKLPGKEVATPTF